jgi:hypothetical protein
MIAFFANFSYLKVVGVVVLEDDVVSAPGILDKLHSVLFSAHEGVLIKVG